MAGGPIPLELRLGLRAGSVYYFQSRELSSGEPHFFVVVNREPLAAKLLLLTIVTSKLDKVRTVNNTGQAATKLDALLPAILDRAFRGEL